MDNWTRELVGPVGWCRYLRRGLRCPQRELEQHKDCLVALLLVMEELVVVLVMVKRTYINIINTIRCVGVQGTYDEIEEVIVID